MDMYHDPHGAIVRRTRLFRIFNIVVEVVIVVFALFFIFQPLLPLLGADKVTIGTAEVKKTAAELLEDGQKEENADEVRSERWRRYSMKAETVKSTVTSYLRS